MKSRVSRRRRFVGDMQSSRPSPPAGMSGQTRKHRKRDIIAAPGGSRLPAQPVCLPPRVKRRNVVRYVPREQVADLQKAIAGYPHDRKLTQTYADLVIRRTRRMRVAPPYNSDASPLAEEILPVAAFCAIIP